MSTSDTTVEIPNGPFFINHDEAAFFGRLDKICGVRRYHGQISTLYLTVDLPLDDESLLELLSLVQRYGGDFSQFTIFETTANSSWFRAPGTFWHDAVFTAGHGYHAGFASILTQNKG